MNVLADKMGRGLLLAADTLAVILPRRHVPGNNRNRVLVVRLDALGDFILFMDALRAIRTRYDSDSWELTLAINHMWKDLLGGQGIADHVLAIDRHRFLSSFKYRYGVIRAVRKGGFDLALNPTYSREAMLGDSLIRCSFAPERIGWQAAADNISTPGRIMADRWYTKLFPEMGSEIMELERNAMFVRNLGFNNFEASMPKLFVQHDWTIDARRILDNEGVRDKFAVMIPGTGPPKERSWPAENWANLCEKIFRATGLKIVLCGSGSDMSAAEEVVRLSRTPVINLVGATSIDQLAGVISFASIVVGSDTGPVHLSGALGVPSVCLLGGAFPGRFFPYSVRGPGPIPVVVSSEKCQCRRWDCSRIAETQGTFPCIKNIGTEKVLNQVVRLVQNRLEGGNG